MISIHNKDFKHSFSIHEVCGGFNLKRDAFYKYQKRFTKQNIVNEKVVMLVKNSRKILPREGTRKLLKSLKMDFDNLHITIGRDQLFNVLRENNLLIKRKNTLVELPTLITVFTSTKTS
ncbi:MAG: putative transposase [bacterium]|jgi:putative transposase